MSKSLADQIADAADRPGPDLAAPAFLDRAHRVSAPRSGPVSRSPRSDGRGGVPFRRRRSGTRRAAGGAHRRAESLHVRRARLRRQSRSVRRSAQQLPERSASIGAKAFPITMSLIYIEVARRAGIRAEGINFPGHFLVRALQDLHTDNPGDGLIVDPFHSGAILNEADCRQLLRRYMGEDAAFDAGAARPRHAAPDPRADAAQPEAALRAHALVPAGPLDHRCPAGAAAVVAHRPARSRTARVPHERLRARRCATSRNTEARAPCRIRTKSSARRPSRSGSTSRRCGDGWRS